MKYIHWAGCPNTEQNITSNVNDMISFYVSKKKNSESNQTKTKPQTEPRPTNFFASLVVKLVHLEVFPPGHKELFALVQGC